MLKGLLPKLLPHGAPSAFLRAVVAIALPIAAGTGVSAARQAAPGAVREGEPVQAVGQRDALYQVPYNGRFTFTRIRYGGGMSLRGWGRRGSSWAHDYPDADLNIQAILNEFTAMAPNVEGSNVVQLEDPRMFLHPLIYISEPSLWSISEEGAHNLRQYLLKGGFLIFDDFKADQWYSMDA